MFHKEKTRKPSTKMQKKATLILCRSLAENYIQVAEDAVKTDDEDFMKELRQYTIDILNKSEHALMILNNRLIPIPNEVNTNE